MSTSIDETDRAIIEILKRDARKSFTDIAKMLNLSEGAVRRRVKNLVDKGVIKSFTVELAKEYSVTAVTFVSVSPAVPTPEVADKLIKIEGVEEVYEITGAIDVMTVISVPTMTDLNKVIEEIRNINGVSETNTSIVLRVLKKH
ncbi:MAG: Lrp/AsnC family transcriptional regulator [Candidatus Caldarchaeum sp.]|nr:Lrp/AsnC family transcriptional regulator [Candidatus Caldarchaeum sp.]MDW8359769.1 Lrp/AsnC family transcriptional regulator [Candidatus Caldarchaeum sp.]